MNDFPFRPIPLVRTHSDSGSIYPHLTRVGVPFPQGAIQSVEELAVSTSTGEILATAVEVTARWPDNSVRWCLVKFISGSHSANADGFLLVRNTVARLREKLASGLGIDQTDGTIVIADGDIRYRFSPTDDQLFPCIDIGAKSIWSSEDARVVVQNHANQSLSLVKSGIRLASYDSLSAIVEVEAEIRSGEQICAKVKFRFEVILGNILSATVQIHNPRRALHKEGIWDLGDPNSFNFNEFSLTFNRNSESRISLVVEEDAEPVRLSSSESICLFQASSGGINWDSPTHMNAAGVSCNSFCGYSVQQGEIEFTGKRASPVLHLSAPEKGSYQIKVREYWQNSPKSIRVMENSFTLGLFPIEHTDGFELQGGERKQHELFFSFSDDTSALDWVDHATPIKVDTDAVSRADVLENPITPDYKAYDKLLESSLSKTHGFLAKREAQDEFGWRHYGEVVADHETFYHQTDDIFVSHYNNQYDPIYGFARQFLLTDDTRWFQLMDDLARHVLDIDIYRTNQDRVEYNYGLFWHTDHYLQAYTASHRTYSKKQYTESSINPKGGGPGAEHCYTSGLKLYYYLTGVQDAHEAVLDLTDWIRNYYSGAGTLIEQCKNLVSDDRRTFQAIMKGQLVFRYRFDFDRGVGNYIRALLDSYELTLDERYITEAEEVIVNTFGAGDDINARNLGDVESTWFYVIFLQEVIRYLDCKRSIGVLDQTFARVRCALLYYAYWMAEHEQPALISAERLQYPNDTWVAQEIRKANVLFGAHRYSTDNREVLVSRAREFRDYVTDALSKSDTLHYARIQIILMQNHGPSALMDQQTKPYPELADLPDIILNGTCFYTRASFSAYLVKKFWLAIRQFSLKRESDWVKARMA